MDSWKSIAAYMQRTVSTVKRWEKGEDLPVHRHAHHRQASVYAYRSEIENWLSNRRIGEGAPVTTSTTSSARLAGYFWPAVAGGVAALSLLALAFFWLTPAPPEVPIDSIAILPFENRTGDPELEYLSEGIAGDVIYSLSQLTGLRVTPTSSVFRYGGKKIPPQTLASDLRVRAVMTGTMTQQGKNLSLRVELVDIEKDRVLWGQQYTRKSADVVLLQKEIATNISESLRLHLSGADQEQLSKQYTTNPEAYENYLRGRYLLRSPLPENLEKAVEYFNSAIDKDPRYALAYAGLADTYFKQGVYSGRTLEEFYQREVSAAQRALELDDTLSEAHSMMGKIKAIHGWDWTAGEEHLKRALELNPNDIGIYETKGVIRWSQRRWAEALEEYKKVKTLDPLYPNLIQAARVHMAMHELDKAIELLKDQVALRPKAASGHFHLVWAYWYNGMVEEAIAEAEKWAPLPKLVPQEPKLPVFLRQVAAGNRVDAINTLENWQGLPTYFRGQYYALLGEKERAIELLSETVEERQHFAIGANLSLAWDPIRSDPRFQALLLQMNLEP